MTAALATADQASLRAVATGGVVHVAGEDLGADDILLSRVPRPGLSVASEGAVTVALDTAITPALLAEGLAREIVNRVQNLRKSADLNVSQQIVARIATTGTMLLAAVEQFADLIREETLAKALVVGQDAVPATKTWTLSDTIDGHKLDLVISLAPGDPS